MRSARTYLMKRIKSFNEFNGTLRKKTSPCYAKFEKVVFGELLGKNEADTTAEKKISDRVEDWFSSGGASTRQSKKLVDAFKELIACKREYPDEFSPGDRVIYRGIRVSDSQLKKWIGGQTNFTMKDGYATTKPFVYKAFDTLESWTAKLDVAKRFAIVYEDDYWDTMGRDIKELNSDIKILLQKIKNYERTPEDSRARDDFFEAWDDVQSLLDGLRFHLKTEKNIIYGVIFMMKSDKGCVLAPKFSNKIAGAVALGYEHEVVRVDVGQSTKAQLLFPAGVAKREELIAKMKELLALIPDLSKHSNKKVSVAYNKFINPKGRLERVKKYLQEVE